MSGASDDFVREMEVEDMFREGTWQNFDPPFPRSTVAAFERRGLIETRGRGSDAEHRWTAYGQAEQMATRLRALGYRVERPHGLPEKLRSTLSPLTAPLGKPL